MENNNDILNYLCTISTISAELTIINTRLISFLFLDDEIKAKYTKEIAALKTEQKMLQKTLTDFMQKEKHV